MSKPGVPFAARAAASLLVSVGAVASTQPIGTDRPPVASDPGATTRDQDLSFAFAGGRAPPTLCGSGPNEGAVGMRVLPPSRLRGSWLNAMQPEALFGVPRSTGAVRLIAVEFIVQPDHWAGDCLPAHEEARPNHVGARKLYGLSAFYELRVWA